MRWVLVAVLVLFVLLSVGVSVDVPDIVGVVEFEFAFVAILTGFGLGLVAALGAGISVGEVVVAERVMVFMGKVIFGFVVVDDLTFMVVLLSGVGASVGGSGACPLRVGSPDLVQNVLDSSGYLFSIFGEVDESFWWEVVTRGSFGRHVDFLVVFDVSPGDDAFVKVFVPSGVGFGNALELLLSGFEIGVRFFLILVVVTVVVEVGGHPAAFDVALIAIDDLKNELLPQVRLSDVGADDVFQGFGVPSDDGLSGFDN